MAEAQLKLDEYRKMHADFDDVDGFEADCKFYVAT